MPKSKKPTLPAIMQAFEPAINHWPKASGPLPTADLFEVVQALGYTMTAGRNKHALAGAMYLRPEGATDSEVIAAARLLNPPHMRNAIQGVLHNYAFDKTIGVCGAVALCKRIVDVPKRDGARVYKMTLSAKGQKQVDRVAQKLASDATATPAKAKAKVARKRKAKAFAQTVAMPHTIAEAMAIEVKPATANAAPDNVANDGSVLIKGTDAS